MSNPSTSPGLSAGLLAGPGLLAAYFVVTALVTATSRYAALDLIFLVVVYALLACTLHFGSVLLARLAWPLGLLASLAVGAVVVWHFREQAVVALLRPVSFAAAAAVLGLLYFVPVRAQARSRGPRWLAAASLASAALLVGGLAALYHGSNTFRWHLLRHNKLVGTPLYYLLSERVESVCDDLWARRADGGAAAATTRPPLPDPDPGASRPDLVFVLVDTLRADALAAYGGDSSLMPALNRFAEGAWVFQDVLSNASWTRPSVASFFTGLLPEEHGAVDRQYRLPEERLTLAEVLRERGYVTAGFVANWAAVGEDAGFAQGFDHFEQLPGGGHPYARADAVNRAVARWLSTLQEREDQRDRPVFLYVHYLDPHTPYLSGPPHDPAYEFFREAYDAELEFMDPYVPRLLSAIERRRGRTPYLFLTSDHGEEFLEHGEGGHGHSLYREVIHLPALLRTPDGTTGSTSARLEARDFFDLMLRLSGDPGLDPGAWATDRDRSTRHASIYSTTDGAPHRPYRNHVCMQGVEKDDAYLIWSAYGSTFELYDLAEDRAQTVNLERSRPQRSRDLRAILGGGTERWTSRVAVRHTDETLELLEVLGYVDSEDPE